MDAMSSRYDYDDEPISMDVFEYISDVSQSHLSVNRREAQ